MLRGRHETSNSHALVLVVARGTSPEEGEDSDGTTRRSSWGILVRGALRGAHRAHLGRPSSPACARTVHAGERVELLFRP